MKSLTAEALRSGGFSVAINTFFPYLSLSALEVRTKTPEKRGLHRQDAKGAEMKFRCSMPTSKSFLGVMAVIFLPLGFRMPL